MKIPAPIRSLIVLWPLIPLSAAATTPAEEQQFNTPMPHVALEGRGAAVQVHRVRLQGYFEGEPDNATRLRNLKAQVASCVEIWPGTARPPTVWPDYIGSQREDTYHAANRTISYMQALAYGMSPADCSLIEVRNYTAVLSSRKGLCKIDMLAKTAVGACDAQGHAKVPPAPVRPATRADLRALAAAHEGGAMGEMLRNALAAEPEPTGRHKTILGLDCAVWPSRMDRDGTVCLSTGGSFPVTNSTDPGMLLEMTSRTNIVMNAVEAQLDTAVNGAVFIPYAAGGFTVKNVGAR